MIKLGDDAKRILMSMPQDEWVLDNRTGEELRQRVIWVLGMETAAELLSGMGTVDVVEIDVMYEDLYPEDGLDSMYVANLKDEGNPPHEMGAFFYVEVTNPGDVYSVRRNEFGRYYLG